MGKYRATLTSPFTSVELNLFLTADDLALCDSNLETLLLGSFLLRKFHASLSHWDMQNVQNTVYSITSFHFNHVPDTSKGFRFLLYHFIF